jgi:hypothetical protein
MSQLGGGGLGTIAGQLGIGQDQAQGAVHSALGVLSGALAGNAAKAKGAAALDQALAKDHDGSILDKVGEFLGSGGSGPGAAILGHVLGSKQEAVAGALGQHTGLSAQQSTSLLTTLAPLLMGALGKAKREQSLNASGLAGMLAGESKQVQESAPGGLSSLLGMVGGAGGVGGLLGRGAGLLKGLVGKKK